MKIDRILSSLPIENGKVKGRDHNRVSRSSSDDLMVSELGRLSQHLAEAVKQVPDVRSEKVSLLRNALTNGEYRVDSDAVARKMLEQA